MGNNAYFSVRSAEMRTRAEKILRKAPEDIQNISLPDIHYLIQEMLAHQLELETQNGELRWFLSELQASRNWYFKMYNLAPLGIFTLDEQGVVRDVNLAGAELMGFERQELIKKPFSRFILPACLAEFDRHRRRAIESKTRDVCELELTRKAGTSFIARLESIALEDDTLDFSPFRIAVSDISEKVSQEKKLKKTEEKYCRIFENLTDVYFETSLDGTVLEVSPSVEGVSGYQRNEIIGKSLNDLYVDPRKRMSFLKRLQKDGKVTDDEVLLRDKDGRQRYFLVNAMLIMEPPENTRKIIGSMRSIDAQKSLEARLRRSEAEKRAILDASNDAIRYVDQDMRIIWANKKAAENMDVTTPEDLAGKYCYNILFERNVPCEDCPTLKAADTAKMERTVIRTERMRGRDGESYWEKYAVPVIDQESGSMGFVQISRDVTDSERVMEMMRTMNAILSASPVGILWTRKRIIGWANRAMHDLLGYEEGALKDRHVRVLYSNAEECDRIRIAFRSAFEQADVAKMGAQWVKKDGTPVYCHLQACLLDPSDPSRGAIVAALDITDRKRAEERIYTLNEQLKAAHEKERRMISRELHDTVAQDLSILQIEYDLLFGNLPALSPALEKRASGISDSLESAIRAVRDLSYVLNPPMLDRLGIVQTIHQLCRDTSEKFGMTVDFSSAGMDDLELDFEMEINLYRLVQEGLNNIRKHANASRAAIKMVASYPDIILRIHDNGKGFEVPEDLATISRKRRMGLRGMLERVRMFNGQMKIQSSPKQGTKIFIKLPYKEQKDGSKENRIDH